MEGKICAEAIRSLQDIVTPTSSKFVIKYKNSKKTPKKYIKFVILGN